MALLNARANVAIRNNEGLRPADVAIPASWASFLGDKQGQVYLQMPQVRRNQRSTDVFVHCCMLMVRRCS